MAATWRAMTPADLPRVVAIAEAVHPAYPESPEVPAERLRLYPAGCRIAGDAVGYAVAHPGLLGHPPALDSLLGALPARADCLYLHDVALLPAARGAGYARALVDYLAELAKQDGLGCLALTAVNRSKAMWRRLGFQSSAAGKLGSYGEDAAYMVLRL